MKIQDNPLPSQERHHNFCRSFPFYLDQLKIQWRQRFSMIFLSIHWYSNHWRFRFVFIIFPYANIILTILYPYFRVWQCSFLRTWFYQPHLILGRFGSYGSRTLAGCCCVFDLRDHNLSHSVLGLLYTCLRWIHQVMDFQ